MLSYALKATVQEEVCIARRHEAGNQYETLDYLPGRSIWGALAALTGIRPGQKPPQDFMTVFYSDDVVFRNLYPAPKTPEGTIILRRSSPIPLSARTRKHRPGFLGDELGDVPGETGGGVCDWLLSGAPLDAYQKDYERVAGFYAGVPPQCHRVTVSRSLTPHHERDPWRGVPVEGRLFSRQNLALGQVFLGYLQSNTSAGDAALTNLLSQVGINGSGPLELNIGRNPGQVVLELIPVTTAPTLVLPRPLEVLSLLPEAQFTVTCLSDTLLVDDYLRPLQALPARWLPPLLEPVLTRCVRDRHFAATTIVVGWNGAYQRPCEDELAIAKGSSFLFRYELAKDKTPEDLVQALNALQQQGLGLRRAEGFGEICINNAFHLTFPATLQEGNDL